MNVERSTEDKPYRPPRQIRIRRGGGTGCSLRERISGNRYFSPIARLGQYPHPPPVKRTGKPRRERPDNAVQCPPPSDILGPCTALMGTAATDRLPGANRGWCEPGARPSGPDHPGAAGRTASRNRGGSVDPAAGSSSGPPRHRKDHPEHWQRPRRVVPRDRRTRGSLVPPATSHRNEHQPELLEAPHHVAGI